MKEPFYTISEFDEKKLFEDSLIFFDTSSLLDFFYFTNENLNELVEKLFTPLQERLWISNHSEMEFWKNKAKVELKPIDSYSALINKTKGSNESGHIQEIESVIGSFKSKINDEIRGHLKTLQEKVVKNNKHPYLHEFDFSSFNTQIHEFEKSYQILQDQYNKFKDSIIKKVEEEKSKIRAQENQIVLEIVKKYFKITDEYKYSKLMEIVNEGEFRYKHKIPPGYMDEGEKVGFQRFGDLIVWKQILEKCKEQNLNLILVTNDVKEDWWYMDDKKNRLSPRYELIKEFSEISNGKFWMYEIGDFLYKTNKYISTSIDDETIAEIISLTEEYKIPELDDEFIDWTFEHLEIDVLRETIVLPDSQFDFECEKDDKLIYQGIIKKMRSHIYTKLMLPVRDFCSINNQNEDILEILVLEYNDPELVTTFYNHTVNKKTLRRLISSIDSSKKRLIVTLNYNGTYSTIFDSHI
ncbi:MAG: PIN-like domain-containing protein [Flavobacterium sp.]|uniref:PIN-like domain-containing protein n=1 Tax=Flavobacterium sp. TaxID=239 RepID=UPI003266CB1C